MSKSPSRAKDFYSLLFLESSNNKDEASKIYYNVRQPKLSHTKELLRITKDDGLSELLRCQNIAPQELLSSSLECSIIGFSTSKAAKLSSSDLIVLALRYKDVDSKKANFVHFMASPNMRADTNKDAMKLFVKGGKKYRNTRLDKRFSNDFVNSLESSYYVDKSIEYTALSTSLESVPKSILKLDPSELSAKAAFFYALIALKDDRLDLAKKALERARETYKRRIDIDKTNFWLWLLTKEKQYFNDLKSSTHINLYTIYFREQNNLPISDLAYKTKAKQVPNSNALDKEQANNPFFYKKFLDTLSNTKNKKALLKNFGSKTGEPFRAMVYTLMHNYKYQYLIHPWKKQLAHLDKEYQALILSLARQESNFIPCALSRSYAIGAMQMMPFLIKSIAKEKKEDVYLPDFFNADKILPYAITHINLLKEQFDKNVFFISYAYNGGSGFTKRLVLAKLFKNDKYDPFLSIELVPYQESREYAKRVVANYYMYRKILKIPIKITTILQSLE